MYGTIILTVAALLPIVCSADTAPSCDTVLPRGRGRPDNDSIAVGTWYLLHCFTDNNKCTEKNCLTFELVTPEERKQLSEEYSTRLPDAQWKNIVLKITTPCLASTAGGGGEEAAAAAEVEGKEVTTPNYLEKQTPGHYKLITLPIGAKTGKVRVSRPVRLELLKEQILVMLDCAELEPVLMSQRAPPPGYLADPTVASLIAHDD